MCMYRFKAGARRLSEWIAVWQRRTYTPAELDKFIYEGLHPDIIAQKPPALLPAPPAQTARAAAARAVWERVQARARATPNVRGIDGDFIRAASAAAAAQAGGGSSSGSAGGSSSSSTADADEAAAARRAASDRELEELAAGLLYDEDDVAKAGLEALQAEPELDLQGLLTAVAAQFGVEDAGQWRVLLTGVRLAFRASRAAAVAPAP